MRYCRSEVMTIDEQFNHGVVHLLSLRKTDIFLYLFVVKQNTTRQKVKYTCYSLFYVALVTESDSSDKLIEAQIDYIETFRDLVK